MGVFVKAFRLLILFLTLFVVAAISQPGSAWAQDSGSKPATDREFPLLPDYYIPDRVTICGEKIPLNIGYVYENMDYEFLLAIHSQLQVYLWLRRAGRYLPYIEKELAKAGLPDDLKYLAIAESDLRPQARSHAKAVGTWQFIEFTGRRYGLEKNQDLDERLHFEKSTQAAISYLKRLKSMFGKWTLAMAAYNCGEGCVAKAIKEQSVRDFFRLDLPRETERYVYRIAAIKVIMENHEKYGYHIAPERVYQPLKRDVVKVNISKDVHFTEAAKAIGSDYKVLKEMNPFIRGSSLPAGQYQLFVPAGLGPKLDAYLKKAAPPNDKSQAASKDKSPKSSTSKQSRSSKFYTVKRGDTLSGIAQKNRCAHGHHKKTEQPAQHKRLDRAKSALDSLNALTVRMSRFFSNDRGRDLRTEPFPMPSAFFY